MVYVLFVLLAYWIGLFVVTWPDFANDVQDQKLPVRVFCHTFFFLLAPIILPYELIKDRFFTKDQPPLPRGEYGSITLQTGIVPGIFYPILPPIVDEYMDDEEPAEPPSATLEAEDYSGFSAFYKSTVKK